MNSNQSREDEENVEVVVGKRRRKTLRKDEVDLTVESDGSDDEYDSGEDSEGSLREFINDEEIDSDMEEDDESEEGEYEESITDDEDLEYTDEDEEDDGSVASITSSMCEVDSEGEIIDIEYVPRVGPREQHRPPPGERVTRSKSHQPTDRPPTTGAS